MTDVIGFTQLKKFLTDELIPRFKAPADSALPGAAVAGAIGGGKTFIFEAVAAELDLPVLVLKNIRSQWFGQTDVIFERLRAVLEALGKVVIFVDEADTQFGRVDANAHETERRLTGKIQQMMSDPKLRGEVLWLLMTARIHLLSPDIRRPGRVGDLIIPVLDPTGDDRVEFINWVVDAIKLDDAQLEKEGLTRLDLVQRMNDELLPAEYSAASFASLRSYLKAIQPKTWAEVMTAVHDQLPPSIGPTREYQTLQALVNCTRRSLLPNPDSALEDRVEWERRIRELELEGIS
jgi:SpoVK/Ycf46/Vps4 family AAA+-type ATPase